MQELRVFNYKGVHTKKFERFLCIHIFSKIKQSFGTFLIDTTFVIWATFTIHVKYFLHKLSGDSVQS